MQCFFQVRTHGGDAHLPPEARRTHGLSTLSRIRTALPDGLECVIRQQKLSLLALSWLFTLQVVKFHVALLNRVNSEEQGANGEDKVERWERVPHRKPVAGRGEIEPTLVVI